MKTTVLTRAPRTSNLEPEAGFTLIELLIVMSIMLILMALAVPQMLKVKKNADQTSAVQTMRTIGSSELSYASSYQGFGCPLSVLGGESKVGAPTAQASQLIDANLAATGHKSGYIFTVTCKDKVTVNGVDRFNSYAITGVPQTVGKTGDRGFCSDQSGIIKFDPAGGTNCTQTLGQ